MNRTVRIVMRAHGYAGLVAGVLGLPPAAAQMGMGVAGPRVAVDDAPATSVRTIVSDHRAENLELHPVTEEFRTRRSSERPPAQGAVGLGQPQPTAVSGTADSEDRHVSRQGYLVLRTSRIHPQPDLRHATDRYTSIDPAATAATASIREALRRPLAESLEFDAVTLNSAIDRLRDVTGVPFVIDTRSLEEAGLDPNDVPVTASVPPSSLRSALRVLLTPLDLTYTVRDGMLVIGTKEAAQSDLVVSIYPLPARIASRSLIDLIQATVAADTWDVVGGMGSIQPSPETNALAIAQTEEVHEEILDLLRSMLDGDLAATGIPATEPKAIPTRLYAVRDERQLQELAQKLVPLCNAALGSAGDPDARVTVIAGLLAVQSRNRGFHSYAAEMIQAITGVDVTIPEFHGVSGVTSTDATGGLRWGSPAAGMGGMGGGMGMGGLCWVAREVYGADSPRWPVFRDWLLADAPAWLRSLYAAQGESCARWLHPRPVTKLAVRLLMDAVVGTAQPRPAGP